VAGALVGTLLFGWSAPAPFLTAAVVLAGVGFAMIPRRP